MTEPWFASPGAFTDLLVIGLLLLVLLLCGSFVIFAAGYVSHEVWRVFAFGWDIAGKWSA